MFWGAEDNMATQLITEQLNDAAQTLRAINVPAPTAWPLVLAVGVTLIFAGFVTDVSISVLGAVLALAGCIGWFREVLPRENEEAGPVVAQSVAVSTKRRIVERVTVAAADQQRAWLPVRTYPVSAGIKGGLAGSVAMAVIACVCGVAKTGSIWYPINLLAAVIYEQSLKLGPGQLTLFHADSSAIAVVLHGVVSVLVGMLYGAMLPMFPRHPIVLGGLVAPLLWSGLVYSELGVVNPLLATHIDWFWFVASQIGFGIVAGIVVARQTPIPIRENLSFALRAGIEAPGIIEPRETGEEHP
jgi:hypothetical protein